MISETVIKEAIKPLEIDRGDSATHLTIIMRKNDKTVVEVHKKTKKGFYIVIRDSSGTFVDDMSTDSECDECSVVR